MGHAPDWCRQNFKKTHRMADGGEVGATSNTAPTTSATPNLTAGMDAVPAINLGKATPPAIAEPKERPKETVQEKMPRIPVWLTGGYGSYGSGRGYYDTVRNPTNITGKK